jgi:hypothetical protein
VIASDPALLQWLICIVVGPQKTGLSVPRRISRGLLFLLQYWLGEKNHKSVERVLRGEDR